MPYYQGDYYRGDYYQGDLFGGIWGGIKGAISGGLKGGLVGAIKGGVTGYAQAQTAKPPTSTPTIRPMGLPTPPSGPMVAPSMLPVPTQPLSITALASGFTAGQTGGGIDVPATTPGAVPTPGWGGAISRFLPGGMSGYSGAPAGYHPNKAYVKYLRAVAMGHHATDPFSAPRAKNAIVKNRKVNPLNPRALRRATARIHGMKRMLSRALRGSGFKISRSGLGGKRHSGGRKR